VGRKNYLSAKNSQLRIGRCTSVDSVCTGTLLIGSPAFGEIGAPDRKVPRFLASCYGNWANNTAITLLPAFASIGGSPYFNINTTYTISAGTRAGRAVPGAIPLDRRACAAGHIGDSLDRAHG
jgi:hypothetical protein